MARPPKSNEMKIAAGTFRRDQITGELMSEKITVLPDPPAYFNESQSKYFADIATVLIKEEKLTVTNVHYVVMIAVNLYNYEQATTDMIENGMVFLTANGYKTPSPWVSIQNSAERNLRDIGKLFGFDPYSATKFKQVKEEKVNKLAEILAKHKGKKA